MSKVLFVFTRAPYSSPAGQEGLDSVLSAATLDFTVSVLFIDDGLHLLQTNQAAERFGLREFTKGFQALADFGVENLYVDQNGLAARGLDAEKLITQVSVIEQAEISALIGAHDQVFTF